MKGLDVKVVEPGTILHDSRTNDKVEVMAGTVCFGSKGVVYCVQNDLDSLRRAINNTREMPHE